MNIFGFRPFKGRFNLGNSDDIPTNTDGTLIGAVKQINADLTANNKKYQADYQNGKYGFTINNEFYQIGGNTMKSKALGKFTLSTNVDTTVTLADYGVSVNSADDYYLIINSSAPINNISKTATSFSMRRDSSSTADVYIQIVYTPAS